LQASQDKCRTDWRTTLGLADRLETRLTRAETNVDRLTPALLARAFRGELVPQDPADEPAAELLKRLHAQAQESREGTSSKRGRSARKVPA